jgi:hypothetical protein
MKQALLGFLRPSNPGSEGPCPANSALIVCSPPPSFPQEGILENKFPFAAGKHCSAHEARYRAVTRFGAGFDFDDLIERFAVKT